MATKFWYELSQNTHNANVLSSILFSKAYQKLSNKLLSKEILVLESKNCDTQKPFNETLSVTETYVDFITFILKVIESINSSEFINKDINQNKTEKINMITNGNSPVWADASFDWKSETASKFWYELYPHFIKAVTTLKKDNIKIQDKKMHDIYTKLKDAFVITDSYSDFIDFMRLITEAVSLTDNIIRLATNVNIESVNIDEKKISDISFNLYDSFSMDDLYKDIIQFKRLYEEYVSLADKISKDLNIKREDAINILELYLRHANAVISDILLDSGDMTLEQFLANTSAPLGYDKFIDFIPGEYEYQKALIQLILETVSTNTTVPQVTDWVYNVDIPDTIDRGNVNLTANVPVTVPFNRKYYHIPEVNVTLRSGTNISALPQITNITETNFTVVMNDNGTISWTAVGY